MSTRAAAGSSSSILLARDLSLEWGETAHEEGQEFAQPIVGSLAGNVLKRFRVELDDANEKLYLSAP